MSITNCAQETINRANRDAEIEPDVLRILREIRDKRVVGNKAHRYLGWAQAKIHSTGLVTLDEFREINRRFGVDD